MQQPNYVRTYAFLLTLLASGGNANAQHMNAAGAPCQGAGSNADETRCFVEEARAADAELNTAYDKTQKALNPGNRNKLEAVQRLWAQFRDANCAAERDLYEGGTAAAMVYNACLAADTRQRIAELNTMYGWILRK